MVKSVVSRCGGRGKLTALALVAGGPAGVDASVTGAIPVLEERKKIPDSNISKVIERLLEVGEPNWTEGEKLLSQRLGVDRLKEMQKSCDEGRKFFENACVVTDPSKVDSDSVITLPVRSEDKGSFLQAIHMKPEDLAVLRNWLLNVDNEHIRSVFPDRAEALIASKLLAPNDFVRSTLVHVANHYDPVRRFLFRSADENHPFWNKDGTMKTEILPEGFGTVNYKGSGQGPIRLEDLHLVPRLMDAYFFQKSNRMAPIDQRVFANELDPAKNPQGYFVESVIARLKAVRPSDLDKEYYYPLESEQPFLDSHPWVPNKAITEMKGLPSVADVHRKFLVKNPVLGRILGDVPQQDRPNPILNKAELMELGFRAKFVKTFAEGGDRQDDKADKNAVKQE